RVVGYGGVTPIGRGYVAAAVRRRGPDRRLRTAGEVSRELAITRLDALAEPLRRALAESGVAVVELAEGDAGQPTRAIQAARGARFTPGTFGCGPGRATTCCTACCASRRMRTPPPSPGRPRCRRGSCASGPPYPRPTRAGTGCCILYMTWRPICEAARRATSCRIPHPASRERDR